MSSEMVWYVARASGIVTWALLAASVSWGLALTSRTMSRRARPAWLLDLHRFMAGAALVFLAIHVGSIAADTYVHFGPVSLLVPFTGHWHPVAVAWGIVAMYVLVALEVTSLLRTRLPRRLWRATHYASFPLFGLATLHALTAGTDRHDPLLRYSMLAVTAGVVTLAVVRAVRSARGQRLRAPRLAANQQGALP
ncbi:MAG TPA: ferric reductase-like transmembrane domain-containing protein [Acidimicrobiales bacterium]|nr:ferric reductase-like transmembrane domain-containing protein [Acidimicrobiales bacterium]